MWKLVEAYARNICVFKELQYKLQQGVTTLVFGDNRDNESQRSNGAGKSALIECIAIGISGSPLRRIKNEEIINDSADQCTIELKFRNDSVDETFSIQRTINRKETSFIMCMISRNGKLVTTNEAIQPSVDAYNKYILEKLGITREELFNNFILSKYRYQDFLSCSDKEKKEIINHFSNGNIVDQAIERITEDKFPIEDKLKNISLELAGVDGRIAMIAEQIESEENNCEEAARTKEEKIGAWNEAIAAKRSLIRSKAAEIGDLFVQHSDIKETDEHIQDLENGDFTLEEYLAGINEWLPKATESRMTDWGTVFRTKKESISKAESELKTWDAAFDASTEKVNGFISEYQQLSADYGIFTRDSDEKARKHDGEIDRLSWEYKQLVQEIELMRKNRRILSSAIETLNNKLAGIISCPSCGYEFMVSDREFDVETGRKEVQEKEQEYITLASRINEIEKSIDAKEHEQKGIQEEKRSLYAQKSEWTEKIQKAERNVSSANHELEMVKRNQNHISESIQALNAEVEGMLRKVFDEAFELIDEAYKANERKRNSLNEDIAAAESSIKTLEKTIREMKEHSQTDVLAKLKESLKTYREKSMHIVSEKAAVERDLNTLQVQERYFVEFKTYLANTKIEALSKVTNEFLQDIGSDIRIRFSGYTVLKSGKVRDKISISLIRSGLDCGSFGKFSAGEAARVNLATILAMQKLVNSNCELHKGLDLLVLDEILEAVDEEGLSCMFAALNSLSITALVVSHGNIAESYPHKIKIIKENGISRIDE